MRIERGTGKNVITLAPLSKLWYAMEEERYKTLRYNQITIRS